MGHLEKITVEVVYASVDRQLLLSIQIPFGSTIETAIDRSGILFEFPEIDLTKQKVGIFSQQKNLFDVVQDGDRIEIYRSLLIDPKENRKRKAKKSD